MINERLCKLYCNENLSNIENYDRAINAKTQTWQCHHRRETDEGQTKDDLIRANLYFFRPACELVFLTNKEHRALHGAWNKGMTKDELFTEEQLNIMKKKCSIASSGKKNPMYGYKWSESQLRQMSETQRNRHFHWSKEDKKRMSKQRTGNKFWNNGTINVLTKECPGPEWKEGRLSSNKRCEANKLITLKRYNKKRMVGLLHTILCCFS